MQDHKMLMAGRTSFQLQITGVEVAGQKTVIESEAGWSAWSQLRPSPVVTGRPTGLSPAHSITPPYSLKALR